MVRTPPGLRMRSSSVMFAASSRFTVWIWCGAFFMLLLKISMQAGMSPGWAAHVPSWPAFTSLSLSFLTRSRAASFAARSSLIGI